MFNLNEVADKMELDKNALNMLLGQCSITPVNDQLNMIQMQKLMNYLQKKNNFIREKAEIYMEDMVQNRSILIDTCSIICPNFSEFMENIKPMLIRYDKHIIIPSSVLDELNNLYAKKPVLKQRIRDIYKQIKTFIEQNLISIYDDGNKLFGDQQFLNIATKFATDKKLLIITMDNSLSEDLLKINNLESVNTKPIYVCRINKYGYLNKYLSKAEKENLIDISENHIIIDQNELIKVNNIPKTSDYVVGASRVLQLGSKIGNGGEGIIYDLNDGTVAKIFHDKNLTTHKRDKIMLMLKAHMNCNGICWPKEILCDMQGNFLGYRMDKAKGVSLKSCLTEDKKYFPSDQKIDVVNVAISVLEKIVLLHKSGILLGDINLDNIIVETPEKVWFVDCDSYQIGGYPCPVGTIHFVAPEIQGKNFSEFLRTIGNENFAVATLLFMIMHSSIAPYANKTDLKIEEKIRNMQFPYPLGEKSSQLVPEGIYKYQWSHLPYNIKSLFYKTFQKDGEYSTEDTRISSKRWLSSFRRYKKLLVEGRLQDQDPQSALISPSGFKCANGFDKRDDEVFICQSCTKSYQLSVSRKKEGLKYPELLKLCPVCYGIMMDMRKYIED